MFSLLLIFQSFALTTSYLEMTNLYDQTVSVANTAHELSTSKLVLNEIAIGIRNPNQQVYNIDTFNKTFVELLDIVQSNVSNTQVDTTEGSINLQYKNGNSANIYITDWNADRIIIAFVYNITFTDWAQYKINRTISVDWDVQRKVGEY